MNTSDERAGDVLSVVLGVIDDESDTGTGTFAIAELHRAVRRVIEPSPTPDELNNVLNLLALPIINGLQAAGDHVWQIVDPPDVVARRLHDLAEAVADYRQGFGGVLRLDDDPY